MADISAEITAFMNAAYGEDVRSALVSLANKLNNIVTSITDSWTEGVHIITSSDDLNSFARGIYFWYNGSASQPAHSPTSDQAGVLLAFGHASTTYAVQLCVTKNHQYWIRHRTADNPNWNDWDNLVCLSDIQIELDNLSNLIDEVGDLNTSVNSIKTDIGYANSTKTDYDPVVTGSAAANNNRWFLNGEITSGYITQIAFYAHTVSSAINIDIWIKKNDILTRVHRITLANTQTSSWNIVDVVPITPLNSGESYLVSIYSALGNAIQCSIHDNSGYTTKRTTDLTSSQLQYSSLINFDNLCIRGYIVTRASPSIDSRVRALENTDFILPGSLRIVAKNNAQYSTITEAVADSSDNDVILVYPGIYDDERIEGWGKIIHIIGIDKNTCIIQNHDGDYATPAIEIDAGSVQNLTIISDASSPTINSSTWGYKLDYCIHADHSHAINKTLRISNCILKNNHRAPLGIGLYDHYTLTIENCDVWVGDVPSDVSSDSARGALYFHNRQPAAWFSNVTEQNIRVLNNTFYSDQTIALYILDTTEGIDMDGLGYINETYAEFINNMFVAMVNDSPSTINVIGGAGGFTDYIHLKETSYGNNITALNYT